MVSFHHALCPTVGSQVLGHGHSTFGGTTAPKCIGWVTKLCAGRNAFFLTHRSKRRLLSTGRSVHTLMLSLVPACSVLSPAPSAVESCWGKLAQVLICCLGKYLFLMQTKFTSVICYILSHCFLSRLGSTSFQTCLLHLSWPAQHTSGEAGMPATVPLKPISKASCSDLEREYFGSLMLLQLLIFHTAGGKPALFEGCDGKGQLLCNILQHRKVELVHSPAAYPAQSIHTDILSRYTKLLFSLFLQAMA